MEAWMGDLPPLGKTVFALVMAGAMAFGATRKALAGVPILGFFRDLIDAAKRKSIEDDRSGPEAELDADCSAEMVKRLQAEVDALYARLDAQDRREAERDKREADRDAREQERVEYIVWITRYSQRNLLWIAERGKRFPPPDYLSFHEWVAAGKPVYPQPARRDRRLPSDELRVRDPPDDEEE